MINPTPGDAEVEDWFVRYAGGADRAFDRALMLIAPWIPIIGIPANDA